MHRGMEGAVDELTLTLPDGTARTVPAAASPRDVVRAISERLLDRAAAISIDGAVMDLVTPIRRSGAFRVLTEKDPETLAVLRHSTAHLLATAVRQLRPDAGIGFGPAIEDGFYYDFQVEQPFTPEDLAAFEEQMRCAAAARYPFTREEVTKDEARRRFAGDPLKLERIDDLGDDEVVSIYTDGPFSDLCRGPHLPDTGFTQHFKLTATAGAYWRGDERRPMLQRIYGTAWFRKQDLDAYLARLEEAKRRDHRVLGQQLDLFSTDPRVGPGLILWHPRGGIVRHEIEKYEAELILRHGYDLVNTPHLASEKLFEISGHLKNFRDAMFAPLDLDGAAYRLKPMNCPGHICIYQSRQRSYRDLPLRFAEFGTVYRYERSGVLHGMLRVRGFTQDDAHVFCTPEQIDAEIVRLLDLVDEMLRTFGYPYDIELATRPEKALGTDETWSWAEATLARILRERGKAFTYDHGGGAFYGPKLDFKLIDAIGRKWQGPTVQLDFNLPERFDLEYVGADGRPHRPLMLHRVLVGSMERFVGGLVEHYGGAFPTWLAPEQVRVLPISDDVAGFAGETLDALRQANIRARLDGVEQTLNLRIRNAETLKVPYMAVIGRREAEDGTLSVRLRGAGRKQESLSVKAFIDRIKTEVAARALTLGTVARPDDSAA